MHESLLSLDPSHVLGLLDCHLLLLRSHVLLLGLLSLPGRNLLIPCARAVATRVSQCWEANITEVETVPVWTNSVLENGTLSRPSDLSNDHVSGSVNSCNCPLIGCSLGSVRCTSCLVVPVVLTDLAPHRLTCECSNLGRRDRLACSWCCELHDCVSEYP